MNDLFTAAVAAHQLKAQIVPFHKECLSRALSFTDNSRLLWEFDLTLSFFRGEAKLSVQPLTVWEIFAFLYTGTYNWEDLDSAIIKRWSRKAQFHYVWV